ncbi:MAG: transglutaminase domain-containing protein [Candidatus Eremiobacteraeota bacterium]|nr:transglutaminase domain-containing protein [Candidatus Eremiobacteraeota bacterium]
MSRLDLAVVACGLLAFAVVGGPIWQSLATVVLGLVALVLHGSLEIPRFGLLLAGLALAVVNFFRTPTELPEGCSFVGPASLVVAFYIVLVTLLGVVRRNADSERLVVLGAAMAISISSGMTTKFFPFVAVVGVQAVLLALALRHYRGLPFRPGTLLAFLPALALAGGLAVSLKWSDSQLNSWVQLFSSAVSVSARFPATAKLTAIQSLQGSDGIVMRVFSEQPPEYLAGRCYTHFTGDAWEWKSEQRGVHPEPNLTLAGAPAETSVYQVAPELEPARVDRYEFPGARYAGATLFTPRDMVRLGIDVGGLKVYRGEIYQLLAADSFSGTYYVGRNPAYHYREALTPELRQAYLQLPKELPPVVGRLAQEVAGHQPDLAAASTLERYLQDNFQYGFDYPFDPRRNALEQFLSERPPAHCEFFATSLALMLRTRGIPARYVTGFLVREQSPWGGYHVVRVKHAHAWVEAHLGGEWVRFDPTPPGALPEPGAFEAFYHGLLEYIAYQWRRFRSFFSLSPMAMLRAMLAWLTATGHWLTANPWWVLVAVVVGIGWLGRARLGNWWSDWSRRGPNGAVSPPDPLGQKLLEFEQVMAAAGLPRPPHLTPLEWSRQWNHEDQEALALAREWVEAFCRVRYGFAPPEPQIDELLEQLSKRNWANSARTR